MTVINLSDWWCKGIVDHCPVETLYLQNVNFSDSEKQSGSKLKQDAFFNYPVCFEMVFHSLLRSIIQRYTVLLPRNLLTVYLLKAVSCVFMLKIRFMLLLQVLLIIFTLYTA